VVSDRVRREAARVFARRPLVQAQAAKEIRMRLIGTAVLCIALGAQVHAQGLTVSAADTTSSIVAAHKGKRITVRLRSGQELSGTVRESTDRLLVLAEVSGREFFDAIVPIEAIEAILVRTRP
jgi:hypothetical protein